VIEKSIFPLTLAAYTNPIVFFILVLPIVLVSIIRDTEYFANHKVKIGKALAFIEVEPTNEVRGV